MTYPTFAAETPEAIPLYIATPDTLAEVLSTMPDAAAAWAAAQGAKGAAGEVTPLPDRSGGLAGALLGIGSGQDNERKRFVLGGAASRLPAGTWRVVTPLDAAATEEMALGWLLDSYRFDRYRSQPAATAGLVAPEGIDKDRAEAIAAGECLTRDLINTPAADMGPAALEAAVRDLARTFGASVSVTSGEGLLTQNFPLVHTVGRAAAEDPRLIEMTWGDIGPTLTLVGKGVCFDTGGLNLKPGASMGLMKKDMGGAATVLGLARMIMASQLEVRLRVLIPAVENSVSAPSFRPGDILTARNGLTVEINNTDAEGRLVLADALAFAVEEPPDLLVSMATLTGAARVAVGPDLAPFYTDHDADALALTEAARKVCDPVWRMPFHSPYEAMIEPGIADLDNAPSGGFAGSITAALFLRRFTAGARYMHFDIYGWNPGAAPARPKGGVGQGARALFEALPGMLE